MEKEEELRESSTPCLHLVSAFLACESPDFVVSFARDFGGGSITERVQSFIWNVCINKSDVKCNLPYLKRFLKKLIVEIESNGDVVLDELYEKYIYCLVYVKDDELAKGSTRMLRRFSFLFPKDCSQASSCQIFRKLEVTLQCSLNMLEGDTGCSIWPSGLFLSEFILSFPEVFSDKSCLEVGSGVGLVGICLAQTNCSKVILTDGDLSTLANMKLNLELNQLATDMLGHTQKSNTLQCLYLPWESAAENELREFMPDIVLGADVIYDPLCLPHLVRVLTILLKREDLNLHHLNNGCKDSYPPDRRCFESEETSSAGDLDVYVGKEEINGDPHAEHLSPGLGQEPVAYIASVIRTIDTFNYFLSLAEKEKLLVSDITETMRPLDLLPYVKSYQRSNVRMFKISYLHK
uniref:Putative ovule protein n=1 Tax=Solanum chacoense TaxID=4108 RepID=A0A0V0I7Y8_SOLCH